MNIEDENRIITITMENGKEAEGKVIFTFETNGENFILYEVEGFETIFAARINEKDELSEVQEDEWPIIEKVYKDFIEEMEKEE
ncbi:MAG: DUF1292 domain-containing protein [Mollicutes bacterium PWAP]|nr:DUF1292 domain-containing protein [Mollicutes bacterium PWAP]